jgi:hypothetical protein
MILPGTYANGFAPRDGEPLFPELWRGCVGAWNPGLGPTGLTLRDWSLFKNHGTLTNMDAGTDWVASQGRYALEFDGTNDSVALGYRPVLNLQSPLTICCWCFPTANVSQAVVYSNMTGSFTGCETALTTLIPRFWNGSSWFNATQPLPANTWSHVAWTNNGTVTQIFINGQLRGSSTHNGPTSNTSIPQHIGSRNTAIPFIGLLDCLELYNRILSPNEIRLLASRRGIAYEMAPRNWTSQQIAAYRARYYSQVIGSGVI